MTHELDPTSNHEPNIHTSPLRSPRKYHRDMLSDVSLASLHGTRARTCDHLGRIVLSHSPHLALLLMNTRPLPPHAPIRRRQLRMAQPAHAHTNSAVTDTHKDAGVR